MLEVLKAKWEKEHVVVETQKAEVATSTIIKPTQAKTAELKTEVKTGVFKKIIPAPEDLLVNMTELSDKDPVKLLEARIRFISNLDYGNEGVFSAKVEKNNKFLGSGNQKYILGEMQVYQILKKEIRTTGDLNNLFTTFGIGQDWSNKESQKKMHKDLIEQMMGRADVLATMGSIILDNPNSRAGLVAVLRGKEAEDTYIKEIMNEKNNPKTKILAAIEKDKSGSLLDKILAIGLGGFVPLPIGLLRVAIEKRDLIVGQKEKKEDEKKSRAGTSVSQEKPENGVNTEIRGGHPLAAVLNASEDQHQNLTAKIRFFEIAVEANVNDREMKIIKSAKDYIVKLDTFVKVGQAIIIPKDMELSSYAKGLIGYYNEHKLYTNIPQEAYFNALTDALAREHMMSLAKKDLGWGFKGFQFGLSFMGPFVGLSFEHIGTSIKEVKGDGGAMEAEKRATVQKGNLQRIGIAKATITESDNTKKFAYTLPYSVPSLLPPDLQLLQEAGVRIETDSTGKAVLISDTLLNFTETSTIDGVGNVTETLIVTKQEASTPTSMPVSGTPAFEEPQKKVKQVREAPEKGSSLASSLYTISRHK